MLHSDGKVESIYCSHDGDPGYTGKILSKHYTEPERVRCLLDLGNLSVIGECLSMEEARAKGKRQYTEAYMRDGGETEEESTSFPNMDAFREYMRKSAMWRDYTYLYKDGKWLMYDDSDWKELP